MERGARELEPDAGLEIIAHRGLHDSSGNHENSRQAVEDALEADVDGIEVDLQLLGDGTLALIHDDVIKTTGKSCEYAMLGSLNYDELKELVDFEPLSLTELLELDWNEKRIILECKPNRNTYSLVRRILKVLDGVDDPSRLTLSSYDWSILIEFATRTSVNLAPVVSSFTGRTRRYLGNDRWPEWHVDVRSVDAPEARELAERRDVILWTLNDPSRLEKLERLGIKGIMTDNPEAF